MSFESKSEKQESVREKINEFFKRREYARAEELIESLPDGEDKFIQYACLGASYVSEQDQVNAVRIYELLYKDESSWAYAGAVLEEIWEEWGRDVIDFS